MMSDSLPQVLMMEFANSTGLSGTSPPRRYLWTDAFAVCNFLGLYRKTGDHRFLEFAVKLVDQVHHILGQHRSDDSRSGWISGLSEQDGELHPTRGGLRIGKTLNERSRDQPLDHRQEWDRDGQYFHYLTKWMHALYRMCRETGESRYQSWATELAVVAQRSFTFASAPGSPRRMSWKMSIDLSRPLVPTMGQHDPLDGLVTCLEMQTAEGAKTNDDVELRCAIAELTAICSQGHWVTDDPLGIGGLLDDASRLAQMVFNRGVERRGMLRQILDDAVISMRGFASSFVVDDPAERRLAFRELGLSVGIHGIELIKEIGKRDRALTDIIDELFAYRSLGDRIQMFWSDPIHRRSRSWHDHCDINTVMLATSLMPEGYLQL